MAVKETLGFLSGLNRVIKNVECVQILVFGIYAVARKAAAQAV